MAYSFLQLKDLPKANGAITQALELEPESVSTGLVAVYYNLQAGQHSEAVGKIETLVERGVDIDSLHALANSSSDADVTDGYVMCLVSVFLCFPLDEKEKTLCLFQLNVVLRLQEAIYNQERDESQRITALHQLIQSVATPDGFDHTAKHVSAKRGDDKRIAQAARLFGSIFQQNSMPTIAGEQLLYFTNVAWNLGLEAQARQSWQLLLSLPLAPLPLLFLTVVVI